MQTKSIFLLCAFSEAVWVLSEWLVAVEWSYKAFVIMYESYYSIESYISVANFNLKVIEQNDWAQRTLNSFNPSSNMRSVTLSWVKIEA